MGFREMLTMRQKSVNTLVCVGLDPEMSKLPEKLSARWGLTGISVTVWMMAIVDATANYACMFKPNIAFWEDIPDGLQALRTVVGYIKDRYPQIPVFMDCKRGDIANTQKHYGSAILAGFGADGMNFSPYMGRSCMAALVQQNDPGKALVGLCYTSNPDARQVQDIKLEDGRAYWEFIAQCTLDWAKELGVVEDAGLVMAAAYEPQKGSGEIFTAHLVRCRKIVGDKLWFLIPGVGAQGGFVDYTVEAAHTGPGSIAINSSSGIINASSGEDYAIAAEREAKKLRDQIREAGGTC
jgi:orotidine-5'-phosphate decarboxylase